MKISLAKQHIKKIFDEALKMVQNGKKPNIYALMKKYGYSDVSARCQKVVKTKTWRKLLERIDDGEILDMFQEIMRDKKDKRARIEAGKELLKLKDRYPAGKIKISAYEEREEVLE